MLSHLGHALKFDLFNLLKTWAYYTRCATSNELKTPSCNMGLSNFHQCTQIVLYYANLWQVCK